MGGWWRWRVAKRCIVCDAPYCTCVSPDYVGPGVVTRLPPGLGRVHVVAPTIINRVVVAPTVEIDPYAEVAKAAAPKKSP